MSVKCRLLHYYTEEGILDALKKKKRLKAMSKIYDLSTGRRYALDRFRCIVHNVFLRDCCRFMNISKARIGLFTVLEEP